MEHVQDLWFPMNEGLLTRIRTGLHEGDYDSDIEPFIAEARRDPSLFLYIVRELKRMLNADNSPSTSSPDLAEVIRKASVEQLKAILKTPVQQMSRHDLNSMTEFQRLRLESVCISAASSTVVAPAVGVEPGVAYSAALVRQLGHSLVAWNYPMVYQRTLSSLLPGEDLDSALSSALGFSPSLLAVSLLREWKVSPDLVATVGRGVEEGAEVNAVAETLAQLCTIGEALARANEPDTYPDAMKDWSFARTELEEHLGSDGIAAIRAQFSQLFSHYVESAPLTFKGGMILDPESRVQHVRERNLLGRNPFIDQCSPPLRALLRSLYEQISVGSPTRENISFLVHQVVPQAGFAGGIVYTADPTLKQLVPQLQMKRVTLRVPTAVDIVPEGIESREPIAIAYQCSAPLMQEQLSPTDGISGFIAGVFGFSQRVGVVYLEVPTEIFSDPSLPILIHFKAVAQALNDTLGLQ